MWNWLHPLVGFDPWLLVCCSFLLIRITLVFDELILSPSEAAVISSLCDFSCICWWVCASSAKSSAKSRSSSCSVRLQYAGSAVVGYLFQSSLCRGGRGRAKASIPAAPQSGPQRPLMRILHGELDIASHGKCSWWCWWTLVGCHSSPPISTVSPDPHCQKPFQSLWNLLRQESSIRWIVRW